MTSIQPAFPRLGAGCGIAGGVGYVAAGLAHGDLPGHDIELALRHVAASPMWTVIHLVGIVSVLLWVVAIAALARTLRAPRAVELGRLAVIAMAIGAVLFTVDYSVDGHALKQAADAWAASGGAEQQRQVGLGLLAVLGGTVSAVATWTFGLPFLLAGLAVAMDDRYPRPLGWVAVVTGTASLVGGIGAYLGSDAGFLLSLACSALSAAWLVILGVLTWRRARASVSTVDERW